DLEHLVAAAHATSVRDELSRAFVPSAALTGDDALGLGGASIPSSPARILVHLRDAWYHNDDLDALREWARAATKVATTRDVELVGVVVNDRPEAPEADTLRDAGVTNVVDATDPRQLVAHARHAQGVVAHSYHVALFALAAGVPAVLATASPYYEN